MAALTANTAKFCGGTMAARPYPYAFVVKNGKTTYQGSLVGMDRAAGHIVPLDDATDRHFVGIAQAKVVGDGTLTCQVIPVDGIVLSATVSGYTAATANGQPVYAGTDDNALTLTRPADDAVIVGITIGYVSSGVGDILAFGQEAAGVLGLAGGSKKRLILNSHTLATFTDSYKLKFTMWGHGLIKEIGFMPSILASTTGKATTLTGDIGGTTITTGTLALTQAGLATAGTSQLVNPTAANEFWDGDVLTLTGSGTTAFSEGSGHIYIDVEYLP